MCFFFSWFSCTEALFFGVFFLFSHLFVYISAHCHCLQSSNFLIPLIFSIFFCLFNG